ncbi:hypothetical protein HGRIS_004452 [Hohenbuehelia grisea]|uniref:Enoyl reductase (ER) domain-containing protein n=1 Tax=Hohenbuehelia grisea TaxID=104357 RepID=A0ABR3JCB4_9AGAR
MTSIPKTQKALIIPELGAPYTLIERQVPSPGPEDVLVKIEAIGLNPSEWKVLDLDMAMLAGHMQLSKTYPAAVGQDAAGIVVDVGSGVTNFSKGDRVLFHGWFEDDYSPHQEYALAIADNVAKIPSSMGFLEASSIPLTLATAALGLSMPYSATAIGGLGLKGFWEDDAQGFYKGQSILILGGSSSIGQFAIQITRYLGFSQIITTSSVKHTDFLRKLGATHVIDRHADIAKETKAIVGDAGFKYIYDCVSDPVSQTEVDYLAPGGTIVVVNLVPDTLKFADDRKAIFLWGLPRLFKDAGKAMYSKLPEFLAKGIIKPNRVEKLPGGLQGIHEGVKRLKGGQVSGQKLILVPSETA